MPEMPDEWDGIELRQFIANKFAAQCRSMSMPAGLTAADRKRKRDYENEVLVRNL
jgi:hypothetical protein